MVMRVESKISMTLLVPPDASLIAAPPALACSVRLSKVAEVTRPQVALNPHYAQNPSMSEIACFRQSWNLP